MLVQYKGLSKKISWIWTARWASWWCSDNDLFDFTPRDFDRKASRLKNAGVNAVITFGGFHFRWGFVHDWPHLLTMLKEICRSCRRYGIKVVEHHSAVGVFHPLGKSDWMAVRALLRQQGVHLHRHPGFVQIMQNGDAEYQGVKFSSMRQIDPRTGQFARGGYRAYPFCMNNPDWQRLYFGHLQDIYACGVDGIMTDDVGFWVRNYSCGCIHCREKFKHDTGYEMPPAGVDNQNFYGNINSPAGRAWILWRIRCHQEYQQKLYAHFRDLGFELARPIYSSSNTNAYSSRGMGVALDNLDGYYSTIFTEVNSTEPQAHCWLRIAAESSHRNALARRNSVPAMCLFYPHNRRENLFCWAMTKTWGQNYWGTNWSMPLCKETAMLARPFAFEKKFARLYLCRGSLAEIGVLFPARTVWLHDDQDGKPDYIRMSDPPSTDCWAGWCEVLTLANIPFDTLGENDLEEQRYFDRLRLIIVPNAVCLSGQAIRALCRFVQQGGHLIITHQSGLKDETGRWRTKYPFCDLIGGKYCGVRQKVTTWLPPSRHRGPVGICRFPPTPMAIFHLLRPVEKLMTLPDRKTAAVFCHRYGRQGTVAVFGGKPGRIVCINRHKRIEKYDENATGGGRRFVLIDFCMHPKIEMLMRTVVRSLLPDLPVETVGFPRGFIFGAFTDGRRLVIHITNAAGTLQDNGKTILIPAPLRFPRADTLPGGHQIMLIKVRRICRRAVLRSPEFGGEKVLFIRRGNDYTVIEVPAKLVRCYSVIEVE